ncbi:MAG TPA: Holliday junction resolvase RuvX [Bacillota bacterium]|nr:Holliday junction resolvase RuvX [Peptococcaceae bacterium MAG4]NLW37092.1 Holliday junction resolvase RuvX [Peptococcaceae bacterium]HPU35930.1 Holliday junction resolvase RuvX [Bacillota bacterium]HPZ44417.1 Holliday junction resolvase RuvX [Bacillota bacterium]HQD76890.1 Holliday junction resolvase RuvX [Bacillota bacterium]
MRFMGLDLGEKRIGVALSDPLGWTAQGLEVIPVSGSLENSITPIQNIVRQYEVEKIIIGMPRNMDGSLSPSAIRAKEFAGLLSKKLGLPVEMYDERLTTLAAERVLLEADLSRSRRRKVIDKMAAVLILQGYLDNLAFKDKNKGRLEE